MQPPRRSNRQRSTEWPTPRHPGRQLLRRLQKCLATGSPGPHRHDARLPGRTFGQAVQRSLRVLRHNHPRHPAGRLQLHAPNKCFRTAGSDGNTLAQNIAGVDILVIQLGTNDQNHNVPLGFLGDPANAGTFFGNMRWVAENYLAAKPTMRVVFITPPLQQARHHLHLRPGRRCGSRLRQEHGSARHRHQRPRRRQRAHRARPPSGRWRSPNVTELLHYYGPTIAQELTRIF